MAEHQQGKNFPAWCICHFLLLRVKEMTEKELQERQEKVRRLSLEEYGFNEKGQPIGTETQKYIVEEPEPVEDSGRITAQEIINRIEDVKESFEISQGITNWRKESPSVFTAFCIKTGLEVFGNGKKNLLKVNQVEKDFCSRDSYDIDLLESIYEYFTFLCTSNDIPIRAYDFAIFCGMKRQVIYDNCNELNSSVRCFYQKILRDNEQSLEGVGIGGKRNSLVIMASLNHRHGWNKDQTQAQESRTQALTSAELPRLGANGLNTGIVEN